MIETTLRRVSPRAHQHPRRQLQALFDHNFHGNRVLDAGAGWELPIHLPPETHLTLLDISAEALNQNGDQTIIDDVQTHRFPPESFDAVLCWWVLEHLSRPANAIERLAEALRPGGLLVIAVPYRWGLKALVTRLTPYRFHVWVARRSNPNAGMPGCGPFPTVLHRDITPTRLKQIALANGLEVAYGNTFAEPPPVLRHAWNGLGASVKLVTFGRYDPRLSEHTAVFRKR